MCYLSLDNCKFQNFDYIWGKFSSFKEKMEREEKELLTGEENSKSAISVNLEGKTFAFPSK